MHSSTLPASNSNFTTFHYNAARNGWTPYEPVMTPTNVGSSSFGELWNSPQFSFATVSGTNYPPHLYAVPLYVENVTITAGPYTGLTTNVVYGGTTNGDVYAVTASAAGYVPAGTILWKVHIGNADNNTLDGVPRGILSTPFINVNGNPPVMYVASDVSGIGWQIFAINITNGTVLTGWPVLISDSAIQPVLQNGSSTFVSAQSEGQRGGLTVSADGSKLYVPFGDYNDGANGFMIVIDTATAKITTVFAGGANPSSQQPNAGMWSAAGPALDSFGNVYITTGNESVPSPSSPPFPLPKVGVWGMSLMVFGPSNPLTLIGTYTPWNYQQMDVNDTDLCGSGVNVLPDIPGTVPHCLVIAGKQGNCYLLDRDNLPGGLVRRPTYVDGSNVTHALSDLNSTYDQSLLQPTPNAYATDSPWVGQTYYGTTNNPLVGPLNVFGPYSENSNQSNLAKARTTPATYQTSDGSTYLILTGATKQGINNQQPIAPCVSRIKIITSATASPYLSIDAYEKTQVYYSPSSPIVTSNGNTNFIAWNLDTGVGVYRGSGLQNTKPYLVATNAASSPIQTLFRSAAGTLHPGGKYNEVSSAKGKVFVGTDRIQTFGVTSNVIAIAAGGSSNSGKFLSDKYFSGGSVRTTSNSITTSGVTNPASSAVYKNSRTGTFSYVFPGMNAGASYSVRLHFCDTQSSGSGQRQFNVTINGMQVLTNYDIYALSGGSNIAIEEPFNAVGDANGNVTVAFTPGAVGTPMVSGIEINIIPSSTVQEQWYDWLSQNGLYTAQAAVSGPVTALADPSASPANDGVSNLWKYAGNLSPNTVDANRLCVPQMSIANGSAGATYIQFTFRQLINSAGAGLTYSLETTPSFSPSNWTTQPSTIVAITPTGDGVTQNVTLRMNASATGAGNLFARLRVSLAQ